MHFTRRVTRQEGKTARCQNSLWRARERGSPRTAGNKTFNAHKREVLGSALQKQTERRITERASWVCKGNVKPRDKTCPEGWWLQRLSYRHLNPGFRKTLSYISNLTAVFDTLAFFCVIVKYKGQETRVAETS